MDGNSNLTKYGKTFWLMCVFFCWQVVASSNEYSSNPSAPLEVKFVSLECTKPRTGKVMSKAIIFATRFVFNPHNYKTDGLSSLLIETVHSIQN